MRLLTVKDGGATLHTLMRQDRPDAPDIAPDIGIEPQAFPRQSGEPINWTALRGHILKHRKPLIIAHLIALLGALASVPVPLLMPLMVDEVLLRQPGAAIALLDHWLPSGWQSPTGYILTMLAATLLLRGASVLFNVLQGRQFTRISKDITFRLRERLVNRLASIRLGEFETLGSGALASRFVTDIETVDRFIGETLSRLLISALMVAGTVAVLLMIDWRLGLFLLLCNPIVIYFSKALSSRVTALKQRENSAFEIFQQALTETLDAVHEIRAANREKHFLRNVVEQARAVRDHAVAGAWKSEAAGRTGFLIFSAGLEVFRALAMLMVLFSGLSVGGMFAVFGYLWFMMTPVNDLLGIQTAYHNACAALQRLQDLYDRPQEPQHAGGRDPFADRLGVSLEVRDLTFTYADGRTVLRSVNLTVNPGEKVAIVGASGGGKSTLIQLLLGLQPAMAGSIRYGGIDMRDIGLEIVREHVAAVLQHPALFNDTVRANLCMGREASEARIWQALEIAELAGFVRAQIDGLYTRIGNRGVRLSGGQRQRLAIARMVLRDPAVVILDEATSALDTETEARIHAKLRDFLAQRTTLIVAHRLSAVRQADAVLVFDDGRITQHGRHEDLIDTAGVYRALYAGH
jgi:ABC-type multidrug transport system fused ATPase/permease subunit